MRHARLKKNIPASMIALIAAISFNATEHQRIRLSPGDSTAA